MEEWTSSVDTVAVQFLPLSVLSFCAVDFRSPQERCINVLTTNALTTDTLPTDTLPNDSGSITIIVASVSVVAAVTVCVIVVAVVVIVALRGRRHSSLNLKTQNSI